MTARAPLVLALLLAGVGCSHPPNVRNIVGQPLGPSQGARIAVADPMFLYEHAEVDGDDSARDMNLWRANLWVGRIWFSEGFDILPEEANQVRSVIVELSEHERYLPFARQWIETTVPRALTDAGFVLAPAVGEVAFSVPVRRDVRGTVEFDGDDNVNLPRFDLSPGPPVVPGAQTDADGILVPVVVNYYSHNAGWFVGQEDGCWGGARVRLFWSLVSPDDGSVMGWGEVATTHKEFRMASPNRQQQQDLLLTVEAEAREVLTQQLSNRRR